MWHIFDLVGDQIIEWLFVGWRRLYACLLLSAALIGVFWLIVEDGIWRAAVSVVLGLTALVGGLLWERRCR